jgi:FtsP/CotA-like multicopper oxidase with cupredoxin domain
MKKVLKKVAKVLLISLASIVVIGGLTYFVLAKSSEMPASMNMGSMDSMTMGHDSAAMNRKDGHEGIPDIPMTSLIEKPSGAPVKTFEIQAEEKKIDTGNGRVIDAWTYNGTLPGPEIRVRQGDRVIVHLKNRLSEGVTIHWHGVELPNAEDGVAGLTQDAVQPGGEFTYDFIAKKPGTYWYHSHQYSDIETTKGLYGTLIVEPKQNIVSYDKDYTAVIHSWDNDIYTVNGTSSGEHFEAKPGDLVRLRIVNTASDTHTMTLIGAPFKVVAIDGYDLHEPTILNSTLLPIAASQRYDVEFKMPDQGAVKLVNTDQTGFTGNFFTKLLGLKTPSAEAENQMLTATFGNGDIKANIVELQKNPLFDFTTYGSPLNTPDNLTPDAKFDRQYDMKLGNSLGFFNGGFTMKFKINGNTYPNIPTYMVKEGDLVKIHIENNTDIPHPMHLHGHLFKVLSKNGKPLSGSPIYLSTLLVSKYESYDIAFAADNPGLWMLHCHNLGHAANGMDMMINYEGVTTPYTVGIKSGNHPD